MNPQEAATEVFNRLTIGSSIRLVNTVMNLQVLYKAGNFSTI